MLAFGQPAGAGEGDIYPRTNLQSGSSKTVVAAKDASSSYTALLEKSRCALETLRGAVEEWGTLTVSEPIVIFDSGQFDLGNETTFDPTKAYIDRARSSLQGGATQTRSTAFGSSLNIQVTPTYSLDLTGKKTPIEGAAGNLDTSAQAAPPVDATANKTADATTAAADPGALLRPAAKGDAQPGFELSDAIAVPLGESAKITEKLGRAMSHPDNNRFTNPNLTVHFAIVQISCNPGWRTRENYIGDVTATCEFYRHGSQTFQPDSDQIRPKVFSVLPLFDAQTLELASSERQLTQLVAQLAAAYPTSVANLRASDLIKLTKQFQSDAATRTPRTVTNSYSTGSSFGFRFSPSFAALKNPAQRRSGAANVLQATSFPALVTIIVDTHHLAAHDYDSVLVHVAHHWFINDRPPASEFWRRLSLPLRRDYVDTAADFAGAVDRAREAIFQLPDVRDSRLGPETPAVISMLYRQYQELRAKATGNSQAVFSFPLREEQRQSDAPVISDVLPRQITTLGAATLLVRGFNFSGNASDYQVWLGQRAGSVKALHHTATQGDQMIVAFAAPTKDDPALSPGLVPVMVNNSHGTDAKDGAVEIVGSLPPAEKPPSAASPASPTPTPSTPPATPTTPTTPATLPETPLPELPGADGDDIPPSSKPPAKPKPKKKDQGSNNPLFRGVGESNPLSAAAPGAAQTPPAAVAAVGLPARRGDLNENLLLP